MSAKPRRHAVRDDNPLSTLFGRRLLEARKAAGFDLCSQAARHLGFHEVTYHKLEKGYHEPTFGTLLRLCAGLGVRPDVLLAPPDPDSPAAIALGSPGKPEPK